MRTVRAFIAFAFAMDRSNYSLTENKDRNALFG